MPVPTSCLSRHGQKKKSMLGYFLSLSGMHIIWSKGCAFNYNWGVINISIIRDCIYFIGDARFISKRTERTWRRPQGVKSLLSLLHLGVLLLFFFEWHLSPEVTPSFPYFATHLPNKSKATKKENIQKLGRIYYLIK